jgi:nephrocystin-3
MPATLETRQREIRVFVSSTFRDMQAERELLIKRVFPELRSICAKRFVTFTEVDLRWGITEEQAAEGKVLPICLEEIERSRPYFIGLLGERYGWIPAAVPQDVIDREPWLKEHVGDHTSVTELEILHGVLNNAGMAQHSFFYFRDRAYIERLSEAERREMVERPIPEDIQIFGEAEANRRTEERKARLAALKERIRQSGLPVIENYSTPAALAGEVCRQFLELIDKLYPEAAVPDPLAREAAGHEAYARSKLLAYVERPSHSAVLDHFAWAESTGLGLALSGESGGGKTALLAAWMRQWRQRHSDDFSFEHYFGATPESANVSAFLVRLLGELKRRFGITEEVPSDPAKLREVLPLWLAQAAGGGRVVLVFDALNQIEGDEADRRLAWLPHFIPGEVRVIASALPGPALDALRERGWQEHELPPAGAAEREAMIEAFLTHYRKALRADLRRRIAAAPGAASPLFLRTVLEELRQFGSIERLPAEVARYLEASNPGELFRLVIERWQQDFDGGRALVRHALRHLWAARQGLAETEWLELLAAGKSLPRQEWTPLFLALEPHLSQRAGLFAFGHDFLRQAARAECIGDEEDVRAAHRALADYFEGRPVTPRNAAELPWQLREAGERDRLRTCLLDIDRFLLIRGRDQNELMRYWVWLAEERRMGKAYVEAFETWSRAPGREDTLISYAANELALFLKGAGLYAEAEPLYRRALAIAERSYGADHPEVATGLNNFAGLLLATNRLAEAEPLIRRALAINEQSYGNDHPEVAWHLNSLAILLMKSNRLAEAELLLRRACRITERSFGQDHLRVANDLGSLARLLLATNRLAEAEPLMRRALAINEQSYGKDHPDVAGNLNDLAQLLEDTNRLVEAEPLMRRALAIHEQSYGKDHPRVATALSNLAQLLQDTNRLAEAEPLMRRALAIDEQSYGKDHTDVARDLNNLARLLYATNRLAEAEPLMRRALEIAERSYGKGHPDVAIRLNNLAQLLKATNRLAEAEPLILRALEIDEQSYGNDHPRVAGRLNNLAQMLQATNRLAEAEPLYRRALAIDEQSYAEDHPRVAFDLNNLAQLLKATNRLEEAEPLMRRTLEILLKFTRTTGHPHPHLQTAVNNYTRLLEAMGASREEILAKLREMAPELFGN